MKQTAVKWLLEQVPRIEKIASFDILEQAKAMEKEQIISVYWDAYNEGKYSTDKTAEEYYKETFIT
jgi:HEPN domain-containing protein